MNLRSSQAPHVTIAGGGFSGTMTAVHLAARGHRVSLVDGGGRFAEGLAYGTRERVHLLNVRASGMSAFPGDADHFAHWLDERGEGTGASFAPRCIYRAYLAEILDAAGSLVARVRDEAVGIERGGLRLASGGLLRADAVVVAAGNLPPQRIAILENSSIPYIGDPWSSEGRAGLAALAVQDGDVLIIGSGLTMIDTVLALDARGFAGRAIALSRRGLLPRAHAAAGPLESGSPPSLRLAALLRWARTRARAGGWRGTVDLLRPLTPTIWQGWSDEERGRFLRHLRPWWDVHRHRIAPQVSDRLSALIAEGRLVVSAGRIVGVERGQVAVRPRGPAARETLTVAGIVDCTGPRGDLRRSGNALIEQMLSRGTARVDTFGLGLEVDRDLRIIGEAAGGGGRLYAIGPMTRGTFWEAVAVPEIRVQAQALSAAIAHDLAAPQAKAAAS